MTALEVKAKDYMFSGPATTSRKRSSQITKRENKSTSVGQFRKPSLVNGPPQMKLPNPNPNFNNTNIPARNELIYQNNAADNYEPTRTMSKSNLSLRRKLSREPINSPLQFPSSSNSEVNEEENDSFDSLDDTSIYTNLNANALINSYSNGLSSESLVNVSQASQASQES
eukprot:Pgem_evm1s3463